MRILKHLLDMRKNLDVKTNIAFTIICQLVIYLAPLLVSPYVSRVLLPEGVGQYSHASSYVYYFSVIIAFGFSSLGISKVSQNREEKKEYSRYFWAIMIEKVVITIFVSAAYLCILILNQFNGKVNFGVGIALLLVLVSNCFDIRFLFQGLENFRIVTIATLLANVLYVASVYLFVKDVQGLVLYTIIKSSLDLAINLFLLPFAFKLVSKSSLDFGFLWRVLKGSAIYFLPNILMSISGRIDQSILGAFCGDTEVGFYATAEKFPTLISSVTFSIAPVILSRTSFLHKEGKKAEMKTKVTQALALALFISLPCCLGLAAIADVFVPFYFGDEYSTSITILYYLLPCSIASPLASIVIYGYFYPAGKTRKMALYQAFAICLNVGLTVLCVASFNMGGVGAALATSVCNAVLLGCLFASSREFIDIGYFLRDVWKILLGGALVFSCVFVFNRFVSIGRVYLVLLDVSLGVLVFFLTLLLSKETVLYLVLGMIRNKLKRSEKT